MKKKNVRLLNGKPLIAWTIDEAKKSKLIDRVVVSTEDAEIAHISREFGAEVIDRPVELAGDTTATIDVVFHALDILKEQGVLPEYVLLLQCTSPLRTAIHIDEAIFKFMENTEKCDSLISVTKVTDTPWWYKKIKPDGLLTDFIDYDKGRFTRRQDFPDVYNENGAIFIAKTNSLYAYNDFETERIMSYIMDADSSIDIDNEIDFIIAEHIMKNHEQ